MKLLFQLICICLLTQCVFLQSAQTLLDETETYARNGALRAKALFEARCGNSVNECDNKVYDFCSDVIPENMEEARTDIKSSTCPNKGMMLDFNVAGGRCSNQRSCDEQEDKRIMCSMASLFDDSAHSDGFTLQTEKDGSIIYSYAGFTNSYWHSYPFRHEAFTCDGKCVDYDPRYRPWYVGAISGAKNLIIIVDFSGSMQNDNRLQSAVESAISVVSTLGQSDWFQVIFFGTSAKTSDGVTSLMPATIENKTKVIDFISKQGYLGGTNFEAAFNLAFDVFDQTTDNEFTASGCQFVILFMTDGQISEGLGSDNAGVDTLINQIVSRNTYTANIFTYSFGANADDTVVKQISCANQGLWKQVEKDNIKEGMSSYYTYMAQDLEIDEVLWSEIYLDSSLGIEMITAAMPIYYEDNGTNLLLGVFGADLLLEELKTYSDFENIYDTLSQRQRSLCASNTQTNCQMEQFRPVSDRCFTDQNQCSVEEFSGTGCNIGIADNVTWREESGDNGEYYSICKGTDKGDFVCNDGHDSRLGFMLISLAIIFVNMVLI